MGWVREDGLVATPTGEMRAPGPLCSRLAEDHTGNPVALELPDQSQANLLLLGLGPAGNRPLPTAPCPKQLGCGLRSPERSQIVEKKTKKSVSVPSEGQLGREWKEGGR